jgi:hypothetical protein
MKTPVLNQGWVVESKPNIGSEAERWPALEVKRHVDMGIIDSCIVINNTFMICQDYISSPFVRRAERAMHKAVGVDMIGECKNARNQPSW